MGRSACTYLSAVVPPSSEDFAMYCRRAPASRPGLAARTSRTATAVWPPAKAVGRARRASVWRTSVAGTVRAEGQETHARAGRGAGVGGRAVWWQRAPTPL